MVCLWSCDKICYTKIIILTRFIYYCLKICIDFCHKALHYSQLNKQTNTHTDRLTAIELHRQGSIVMKGLSWAGGYQPFDST